MYWLKRERTTMDRLLPGLDEALADLPLPNVTPGQRAGVPSPGAIAAAESGALAAAETSGPRGN